MNPDSFCFNPDTRVLGRFFRAYTALESTNDTARQMAEGGAEHGTAVFADTQTRGRGQEGRGWFSPPGVNLYTSCVMRPEWPPRRLPLLPVVAALAIVRLLQQAYRVEACIKYPNDVLLRGKKVAGILSESACTAGRVKWAVLGIGVNLNLPVEAFPPDLRGIATSLSAELGEPVQRREFAQRLYEHLEAWYDQMDSPSLHAVQRVCTACACAGEPGKFPEHLFQ